MDNLRSLEKAGAAEGSAVITDWPDSDFLLFQEVWDRLNFMRLANKLRDKGFGHFLVDIGKQSWASNFCVGGTYVGAGKFESLLQNYLRNI